eukprot:gene6398-9309_t
MNRGNKSRSYNSTSSSRTKDAILAKERWRNWWIRGILSLTMLAILAVVLYLGPLAIVALIYTLQVKCLHEVISLGYKNWPRELPWFRSLNWYFVLVANLFFFTENFDWRLHEQFSSSRSITMFINNHRFIAFSLYLFGFVTFVLSLKKGFYLFQFVQFGWTHLSLLVIASASVLIMRSIYEGLIWFLLPVCLVVCNDIMAYMFGFFCGRTQLISLSPKKTWEGFLGAFASTVLFSVAFTSLFVKYPIFICPNPGFSHYNSGNCEPSDVFLPQEYQLPDTVINILSLKGVSLSSLHIPPAIIHAVLLAVFASLIAPFGGFFASGLKRAFKIKDFDNLIPGHGGATDRFDCQLIMAVFFFVYYQTFIKPIHMEYVLNSIYSLPVSEQLTVYQHLHQHLVAQDAIQV